MKLNLLCTSRGLIPCYDEDYDEKKKLKNGEQYVADIKLVRNVSFHRLFFALVNTSWEYLPERLVNHFKNKENFRKYLIGAAGFTQPYFHPHLKEWLEIPKSISFESMDEAEFRDLYERVKDVVFLIIGKYVTREDFERNLANF